MKSQTEKISITISDVNHKAIKEYAKKIDRSKSKTIDLAITDFLEKNVPNYKYKQILKDSK
jgi:predicted transcriptional regulator